MAVTLYRAVGRIFRNLSACNCYNTCADVPNTVKYMEIPVSENQFELPLFAFSTFQWASDTVDAIVVSLNTKGRHSSYKSFERAMIDCLSEKYSSTRLAVQDVKQGNDVIRYYCTQGAIFDDEFNPIMMCSLLVGKEINEESGNPTGFYEYIRPVIRFSPNVFTMKGNPMERFMSGKLLSTFLADSLPIPDTYDSPRIHRSSILNREAKVIIDKIPFSVHSADVPSISTTNEDLLNIVASHIDELIQ